MFDKVFKVGLLFLLVCIIALQAVSLAQDQAVAKANARSEACKAATAEVLAETLVWSDNYQTDAYGVGVDRIAEQQLIAAEYQLTAQQAIAQVLAACQ